MGAILPPLTPVNEGSRPLYKDRTAPAEGAPGAATLSGVCGLGDEAATATATQPTVRMEAAGWTSAAPAQGRLRMLLPRGGSLQLAPPTPAPQDPALQLLGCPPPPSPEDTPPGGQSGPLQALFTHGPCWA